MTDGQTDREFTRKLQNTKIRNNEAIKMFSLIKKFCFWSPNDAETFTYFSLWKECATYANSMNRIILVLKKLCISCEVERSFVCYLGGIRASEC